jgi:hypothetical protein
MLTRYALFLSMIFIVVPISARAQNSAAEADIDEDFSIITGLSGGPTSYLDGIKEMHWVLKLLDQCGLDEQHIRGSSLDKLTGHRPSKIWGTIISGVWARRATPSPTLRNHTGKLSCLRGGSSTVLPRSVAKARAMRGRVACGMITSSI